MSLACLFGILKFVLCVHHSTHVEARGQLSRVGSFLPPCGSQGLIPGPQAWWQACSWPDGPHIQNTEHRGNEILSFHRVAILLQFPNIHLFF